MSSKDKASNSGNAILVVIAMIMGLMMGLMFGTHSQKFPTGATALQTKMSEALDLVETYYVDTVEADSLSERLVSVMMSELDPHSTYLSAKETERTEELMRGNFEGVGLIIRREGDTSFIGQVLPNGPSAGSGLLPGDMIWSVDGVQVSGVGMPSDSVVARLRGPRRSTVDIAIRRGNATSQPTHYKIRRGVVSHSTLPYYDMLDDTTGYIILSSFSATSHLEFHDALQALLRRGMTSLVFDLRGNTGGALSAAIGIANEMLPTGSLIVYTQGAHQPREDYYAQQGGSFTRGKVVVMVDERSASASEVVSGALQDNDRATIVGRRTFGKGLVQRDFTMSDGASLLLTVARYYTPSGRSIQRPYDDGTDEYYRVYLEQLMEESYADNPTLHITDSTPYHTVGGRVVYGGGGIFPDRLIPYHKDSTIAYYNKLLSKNIINRAAFGEVRANASEWKQAYPTLDSFCRRFAVSNAMVQRMTALGAAEGIPVDAKGLAAQRRLIATMLKAHIAGALFGDQGFYRVCLDEDEDLNQVRAMRF